MPGENEKQVILRLVQSKQITPEEGARLLAAMGGPKPATPATSPASVAAPDTRLLKLHAEEASGHRVELAVPLKGLPAFLRFAARWVPEDYQETLHAAADSLATGYRGDLLNVEEPSGQRVRVWIE